MKCLINISYRVYKQAASDIAPKAYLANNSSFVIRS
jgi:hypothetical protein